MEIIKRYTYKAPFGNNQISLRNRILKEGSKYCTHCNEVLDKNIMRAIVLDHRVPVSLGGDEFSEDNLQLLCAKCNRIKTNLDHQIISFFERLQIVNKNDFTTWRIYVPKEEIAKLYLSLQSISVLSKKLNQEWLDRDYYERKQTDQVHLLSEILTKEAINKI